MDEQQKKLAEELLFGGKKAPGFAKSLYFGKFDSSLAFPYPEYSEEEVKQTEHWLQLVKDFADRHIDPEAIDRNAKIPDEVIKGLGHLGVLAMTIPKEYGGSGATQHSYCTLVQEVASRCASTALLINAHQSIGLRALLLFGTEEQKKRWLPPLAKGEYLAAFALTEPNAGSDANGIETRAVYDPKVKGYRINGKKQWITNGGVADILTVMAKTEIETPQGKTDKVTAFLVTPDMPGFKVAEKSLEKVGYKGTWTANLEFEDMIVPENHVLGPVGGGLKVCLTVLDYGRTTFGAMCSGAARFCLRQSIGHAKTRYQFKRPLASFGMVKQKIAQMAALAYAMEAATFITAGFIDKGTEDIMLESAILKVFASDSLWSILYDTMQIFGGRSFFTSAPFERMMRDARLNMIGEGSNEVMRVFIGAVGMRDVGVELQNVKNAFSTFVKSYPILGRFASESFKRFLTPKIPVKSKEISIESRRLSRAVRRFGFEIVKLLAAYREEIIEKQLVLNRVATAAIALYTTTAVLSKLDQDLQNKKQGENDLEIGKLYCCMALDQFDCSMDRLYHKQDDQIEQLSDRIVGAFKG